MTKAWQIYYDAVFGAIGGLIAWMVVGKVDTTSWNIHLANMFVGAGIGFFIGGALGTVDGLIVKRSPLNALFGALGGVIAGLISGMLGLLTGGFFFVVIGGGLIARLLGWMTFGLFLGLGLGMVGVNIKRAIYGLIGGAFAGLVGGLLYEIFTQLFLEQIETVQMLMSALGLVLIGISLGIIIPISISLIGELMSQRGIIVYLSGPRKGTEVELIGSATLGSSDACHIYIQDRSIEKRQGQIDIGEKGFEIRNIGSYKSFGIDQSILMPGQSYELAKGSEIQMGDIKLIFQAR